MDWQTIVTAVVVAGCSAHAVWILMPRALRTACLARWRGTPAAAGAAAAAASPACGGGCSGCGSASAPAAGPAAPQPIRIVRAPRAGG